MKRKSRYSTMRAATHKPTPIEAPIISSTKNGRSNTSGGGDNGTKPSRRLETRSRSGNPQIYHDRAYSHHELREIHFGNHARVHDEAVAAFVHGIRKELPRQHAAKNQKRVRHATRRHLSQSSEYNCKYQHREQRPDQRPAYSDNRLLVTDEEVPPREERKQFAITPEIAPVLAFYPAGFDY